MDKERKSFQPCHLLERLHIFMEGGILSSITDYIHCTVSYPIHVQNVSKSLTGEQIYGNFMIYKNVMVVIWKIMNF